MHGVYQLFVYVRICTHLVLRGEEGRTTEKDEEPSPWIPTG